MLTVYQSDYRNIQLRHSADLVITSIPLDILNCKDGMMLFNIWLKDNAMQGTYIFDIPAEISRNYLYSFEEPQHTMVLHNLYEPGKNQELFLYGYNEIDPPVVSYRECYNRAMGHACEFDKVLIEQLIKQYSEKEDVVLDPFCGTGIVPRMAHELGRYGVGIDKRCPYTNAL